MKKYLFMLLALCIALCICVSAEPGVVGGVDDLTSVLSTTPEDSATADEVVVVTARLHSVYNGGNISESSTIEECYKYALDNGIIFEDLFPEGRRDTYPVSRAELAYMLASAIPEEKLAAVNSVLLMPDSDPSSLYYEPALILVNAGIIEGVDNYGSFGPTRCIKHYELNNIIRRIFDDRERIVKDYLEYASDEPYYLINDFLMGDTSSVRGVYNISSGWKYDYTGSMQKAKWIITGGAEGARDAYANTLRDISTTDDITISREIFPQKSGELVLETSFHITMGFSGLEFFLEDIDGNNIFEMGTYSSGLYFISDGKRTTRYLSYPSSGTYKGKRQYYLLADPGRTNDSVNSQYRLSDQIRMRMHINLDTGVIKIYISGTQYAYSGYTYKLKSGYNGLKKLVFSTGISDQIEYTVKQVHLYKNYAVNDKFITHKVNTKPYDYTTSGDVTVSEIYTDNYNQGDFYSVLMHTRDGEDVYARKDFNNTNGIVKLETYLLIPDGNDGVYFDVGYGANDVLRIITKDRKFYVADKNGNPEKELRFFTPNTWQCIRIEADTNTQTALIKINGKIVAEDVPFRVKSEFFNRLEIGCEEADGDFEIWFDDVEVHKLYHDPEDYVPEPVPLDTGDYILSMSVCNLWRNGSHYGWTYIEPHAEIQPITGFYDEGNAEAMDWEIKFLAEHGVSTYAMCWYAPTNPASSPIKKPRMIDAHHEGYFNAKYTDYLDFSIMWENASYGTPGTSEQFKKNIFPFWMDWYFSDDRYFRIEEDGKEYLFLTIYQWAKFRNMCLPARSGVYDDNINDMYSNAEFNQAEIDAASIVKWMEEQVIEAGYADGIILCFTNSGASNTANISMLNIAGANTAIFPYAWGNTAYNVENQKQMVETYYALAQSASNSLVTEQTGGTKGSDKGLDLLALAAVGFNDIGWAQRRYPLISDPDFEELLVWYRDEYMPRYKDDEDSWKQYFIQFDTWNEYGEGHYIYPTVGLDPIPGTEYQGYGGYGYLESMAKVFGENYDAELHKELDIIPTQEQKNRIGRLYVPNKRMYIRREFLPTSMKEAPVPAEKTKSFIFNNTNSVKYISALSSFYETTPVYDSKEKAVVMTSKPASGTQSNPDPVIHFSKTSEVNGLKTEDCSVLHIRMKTSKTGSPAQVFFRVDTMPKNNKGETYFSEDYQYTFHLKEANQWNDYYIDLHSHEGFIGTIEELRFDPGNLENNKIYLAEFELLKFSNSQKRTEITIDGTIYTPTDYWEIQNEVSGTERNEIYIAPADDNGLYKLLHIVYDWNENTGKLLLDTPDGTTFEFNVGSNKVIVDGDREETLPAEMYIYDGVPVIPLLYILDNAGYNYVHNFETKDLDITVCDPVKYESFPNAKANDKNNTDAFYSLSDSTITIDTDPDYAYNNVWKVTGGDVSNSYFMTDMDFVAGVEYTLEVDMKLIGLVEGAMGSRYTVELVTVYNDGTEVTEHTERAGSIVRSKWNHLAYKFTIPETLVKDGNTVEKVGIMIRPDDWEYSSVCFYVDNFSIRRQPSVFRFKNGDAEDEDMSMWYASNTYCNRVWDEEMNSWVIEITPVPNSGSAWSYLRQQTEFEAGVTYYFSFDAKMGENTYGDAVTTSFSINSRYADFLQQHFTQNPNDHSVTFYGVNKADGWKHYSGSFTVSIGRTNAGVVKDSATGKWVDEITWFVNPLTVNGAYSPMTMRFDNIKFSTTPIE